MRKTLYKFLIHVLETVGSKQLVMSCSGVLFETKIPDELKSEDQ